MKNEKGKFKAGEHASPQTEFKKGHKPWNTGLKGIHLSPKSEFKKGQHAAEKHPNWRGGIQKPKNGCVQVYKGVGQRKRRPRHVYENVYGDIPKGHVIYHKDGDKLNDSLENLEAISRAELLKRNMQ